MVSMLPPGLRRSHYVNYRDEVFPADKEDSARTTLVKTFEGSHVVTIMHNAALNILSYVFALKLSVIADPF